MKKELKDLKEVIDELRIIEESMRPNKTELWLLAPYDTKERLLRIVRKLDNLHGYLEVKLYGRNRLRIEV